MKILIAFLLVLGMYCQSTCKSNQFEVGGECIPCAESLCKECDGSSTCKSCPDGIEPAGICNTCTEDTKMPINKVCVSCSTFGGLESTGNPGKFCECAAGDTVCCMDGTKSTYRDGDECHACSSKVMGCSECTFINEVFECKDCAKGYKLNSESKLCEAKSFGAHFFALGGLLLSLLILV